MRPAIAGPAFPCLWCRQPIVFVQGQSWLHPEGGLYMRRCNNCGWRGAPSLEPDLCPSCHGAKLVDDHLATPDRSTPRSNPPADSTGLLPIRTQPRPPAPSPATAAARPQDDAFVQDATSGWSGGEWPARFEGPAHVVRMPLRAEFVAEVDHAPVRVVCARRDGKAHLVHVYDADGDILPFLHEAATAALRDQAEAALAVEEREAAALEEARHVGRL